ncbi:hypothetical protein B0A50_08495 [Salinomyces thailandicus]|uniref:Uncharacterized protein n=1 Tax=Salinomyces thailandicus TaxID=706561 RepID=A0A4U0TJQ8_9PEZI|nr:hypothetical protein B0A50_08495 [Salinomyces thailandica]
MVIFIHDSAPSAGSPPPSYTIDVGLEAEQDKPEEHQQPGQTYPSRATDTICSVPEQNNACEQEINPRPQAPQRARVEGIARHTELVHEANMALQPYKAIIVVIAVVVANYFFVGGYKCVYKNETCENRNDNEHGRSNIDDDDHDVRQEQHLRNLAFQMTLFTTGVVVGQVVRGRN